MGLSFLFGIILRLFLGILFGILHLAYQITSRASCYWSETRHRQHGLSDVTIIDGLRELGARRKNGTLKTPTKGTSSERRSAVAGITNLPRHIALAFIPETEPSTVLAWRIIKDACSWALRHVLSSTAADHAHLSKETNHTCQGSPGDHPHDFTQHHHEQQQQLRALRNIVHYSALVGVTDVSVWDDQGQLGSIIAKQADRSCDPGGVLRWQVNEDTASSDCEGSGVVFAEVFQPGAVLPKSSCLPPSPKGGSATDRSSASDSAVRVRLHLLTPAANGRRSFASLSGLLAQEIRQNEKSNLASVGDSAAPFTATTTTTTTMTSTTTKIASLTPASIDSHLHRLGLSPASAAAEPDLLIVWGGHWSSDTTIADYPRWDLRLTEIVHIASSYAVARPWLTGSLQQCWLRRRRGRGESDASRRRQRLPRQEDVNRDKQDLLVFGRALEQFARAEQRYGR